MIVQTGTDIADLIEQQHRGHMGLLFTRLDVATPSVEH
jgi:hypothetical protein